MERLVHKKEERKRKKRSKLSEIHNKYQRRDELRERYWVTMRENKRWHSESKNEDKINGMEFSNERKTGRECKWKRNTLNKQEIKINEVIRKKKRQEEKH